jgi:hypothetical protein
MHAANEPITPDPRRSPKPAQQHGIGCARQEGRKQAPLDHRVSWGRGSGGVGESALDEVTTSEAAMADARRVQSKAGVTAITRCRPRRAA